MPHLDAKALDTDPEGMALLRAAIAPDQAATDLATPAVSFPFLPAAGLSPIRLRDRMIEAMLRLPPTRVVAAL